VKDFTSLERRWVMATISARTEGTELVLRHEYTPLARRIWAGMRIGLGWIFLWAFLDKTFALGFATGRLEDGTIDYLGDAAWLNGASPTYGFLTFATKGPFAEFFQGLAGQTWVDWLFMLGLLGLGLLLIAGVGMRIAALGGSVLLILMWLAALWPVHNPFLDDHLIYAVVLIGLALVDAGDTWGLGKRWGRTSLVHRYPILK
jgi:thiosulfate dehydrogenase [quinone] large subunit